MASNRSGSFCAALGCSNSKSVEKEKHYVPVSVLARIWIFFLQKKELLNFFRELFAKERSYPSTTKLHDEVRKQVRNLYITCTKYTKQNIVPL